VKVHELVIKGWSTPKDEKIKPFYQQKDELTEQSFLQSSRNQVLTELHEGHLGIVKMKSLARSHIWWPKIDKDIEHLAKSCSGNLVVNFSRMKPAKHHYTPGNGQPHHGRQSINLDFAGPFLGRMFLIIRSGLKWK
jgi:hypothetical protein